MPSRISFNTVFVVFTITTITSSYPLKNSKMNCTKMEIWPSAWRKKVNVLPIQYWTLYNVFFVLFLAGVFLFGLSWFFPSFYLIFFKNVFLKYQCYLFHELFKKVSLSLLIFNIMFNIFFTLLRYILYLVILDIQ